MAVYSGRFGCISGCSQVTQWSVTTQLTDNAHSNSYTRAGKMRDEGVKDWNGSCTILGNSFPGGFDWNGSAGIELYTGGPTWGGNGRKLWGDAIWTSIALSGDISSGQRVQCQVSFSGDGKLNEGAGSHTDTDTPNIWLAKDCVITYGSNGLGAGNTLNWKSFSFTINHEVQELLDSTCFVQGQNGNAGDVWKKRYPGIIDCTGTIDWVGDLEPSTLNTIDKLTISCKGTTVLEMKYARYMGMGSFTVDPSSGALIGGSSSFNMCAHSDPDNSGNVAMGSLTVLGISLFPPSSGSTTNTPPGNG